MVVYGGGEKFRSVVVGTDWSFCIFSSWYLMSLVLLLSSFLSSFLSPGYACAAPGTVCDRCDLHQKIRHNSEGMEDVCPFCLNVKVAGVTPICEEPACQDVKDLAGAIACDKKVDDYCKALQASGSNDPGCINYVSEERKWAVPRVANKCKLGCSGSCGGSSCGGSCGSCL